MKEIRVERFFFFIILLFKINFFADVIFFISNRLILNAVCLN